MSLVSTYGYLSAQVQIAAGKAAGAPLLEIQAPTFATHFPAMGIVSVGVQLYDSTATDVGLVIASGQGTATTQAFGVAEQGAFENDGSGLVLTNATYGALASAWSAAPAPAGGVPYWRRVLLQNQAQPVEWSWPEFAPLLCGPSQVGTPARSILVVNAGAVVSGALSIYVKWAVGQITCNQFTRLPLPSK